MNQAELRALMAAIMAREPSRFTDIVASVDALLAALGASDKNDNPEGYFSVDEPEPSCPHWQHVRPGKWQCSQERDEVDRPT